MLKFIDATGKETNRITVLGRYFRLSGEGTKQFLDACKGLTEPDKDELAVGAAKELGFGVKQ